jgi:hexosaminidase
MYIGQIKDFWEVSFTHKGTAVPFEPQSKEDCVGFWQWRSVYDDALDVNYTLAKETFVGDVSVDITEASVSKIEILVDGVVSGAHNAETGKLTGGVIDIPVGCVGKNVTVRFYTWLRDLKINSVEILGAQDDEAPLVWPTPKSIEYLGGYVKIRDVVSKNGDPDEVFAAEFLKERLTETFGDWQSKRGYVIEFDKRDVRTYQGERYTVNTVRGKIKIAAKTRLALLYGGDTVLQLFEGKAGLPKFNCDDKPSKELRGFHAGIPQLHQFEFMRRLFRYVLLPLRFNTFYIQVSACMELKRHPEITEAWRNTIAAHKRGELPTPPHIYMLAMGDIISQEDVVRYVNFARELGFEIIPEVQSLGHVQYITLAHPELAEIKEEIVDVNDTRTEDERPAAKYHHCYCPSLEESYKLIFEVIDEVVDVIKPARYVHIGHDEIYEIGVCKRCREKDPADLLAEHVTRLHDHLKEKGLGTMMWADMLQPPPARPYKTYKAIDRIPKDIIMLDFVWYFNIPSNIEDNLLKKGFKVAVGNLYSSHFPRYTSRMTKKNMIGGELSTWLELSEEVLGNNGKMWDAMYLSEMLWNTENYDARNRRTYTEILAKNFLPEMRDNIRGKYSPLGYKETSIKLPRAKSAPAELRELCPKAVILGDEKIEVGAKFERLVFEHATVSSAPRIVWVPIEKIGDYVITYADGEELCVPVKYAENVMAYKTAYSEPMPQGFYRHNGYVGTWFADPVYQGKNEHGEDLTVTGFIYENPNPKKEIKSIEYRPTEGDYCGLILAGIKGLNKR